ncbi:MAG: hypothetical protein QOE73_1685 [Verrucomicrobiota bacterium]
MIKSIAVALLSVGLCLSVYGQATSVNMDSGGLQVYNQDTSSTILLSGGGATTDGDGFVLQLGFYQGATIANNFGNGVFVPITGEGSGNTSIIPGSSPNVQYQGMRIGDVFGNGGTDGEFWISGMTFRGAAIPAGLTAGTPLSIRIYNGTTIAASTFYNAVSDDLWVWQTPAQVPPPVNVSLGDPNLEWYSIFLGQNANTAFHTTVLVPEPSTFALFGVGALAFAGILRRRAKV